MCDFFVYYEEQEVPMSNLKLELSPRGVSHGSDSLCLDPVPSQAGTLSQCWIGIACISSRNDQVVQVKRRANLTRS
jgi:hypothetical protein